MLVSMCSELKRSIHDMDAPRRIIQHWADTQHPVTVVGRSDADEGGLINGLLAQLVKMTEEPVSRSGRQRMPEGRQAALTAIMVWTGIVTCTRNETVHFLDERLRSRDADPNPRRTRMSNDELGRCRGEDFECSLDVAMRDPIGPLGILGDLTPPRRPRSIGCGLPLAGPFLPSIGMEGSPDESDGHAIDNINGTAPMDDEIRPIPCGDIAGCP